MTDQATKPIEFTLDVFERAAALMLREVDEHALASAGFRTKIEETLSDLLADALQRTIDRGSVSREHAYQSLKSDRCAADICVRLADGRLCLIEGKQFYGFDCVGTPTNRNNLTKGVRADIEKLRSASPQPAAAFIYFGSVHILEQVPPEHMHLGVPSYLRDANRAVRKFACAETYRDAANAALRDILDGLVGSPGRLLRGSVGKVADIDIPLAVDLYVSGRVV